MANEFNAMVEMHRHAANKVEALTSEIDQLMEQNGRLRRDREAAESENARLREQVQMALHGRVKESPGKCNEATGPNLGPAMERITERPGFYTPNPIKNALPGLVMCPHCTAQFEPGPGWFNQLSPQGKTAERS